MHLAGALLLAPGHAPESWLGPEAAWPFQTVCEITSCGHVTPSIHPGLKADGEAHTTTTTEFLKGPRGHRRFFYHWTSHMGPGYPNE